MSEHSDPYCQIFIPLPPPPKKKKDRDNRKMQVLASAHRPGAGRPSQLLAGTLCSGGHTSNSSQCTEADGSAWQRQGRASTFYSCRFIKCLIPWLLVTATNFYLKKEGISVYLPCSNGCEHPCGLDFLTEVAHTVWQVGNA